MQKNSQKMNKKKIEKDKSFSKSNTNTYILVKIEETVPMNQTTSVTKKQTLAPFLIKEKGSAFQELTLLEDIGTLKIRDSPSNMCIQKLPRSTKQKSI